jgi:hypothetical protein
VGVFIISGWDWDLKNVRTRTYWVLLNENPASGVPQEKSFWTFLTENPGSREAIS